MKLKKGQTWRFISLGAQLLALVVMAIPGSYVWCDAELTFYTASYLWNDPLGFYMPFAFALSAIAAIISTIRINKKGLLFFPLLLNGGSLWLAILLPGRFAIHAWVCHQYVWLPFLPPFLLALSMIAAVVAWLVGRKE